MTTFATVTKVLEEGQKAEVAVLRKSACAHDCAECGGCNTKESYVLVVAESLPGAEKGKKVVLESETKSFLQLILFCTLIPLILMFTGFAVLSRFSEFYGILGALAGLSLGAITLFPVNRYVRSGKAVTYRITKIL